MARSMVDVAVMTYGDEQILIGSSFVLLEFLCPLDLVVTCFNAYLF